MNSERLKKIFWDAFRPFHAPLTRMIRRRLGRNYPEHPEMELPLAYEAVQLDAERRLHRYLHCAREQVEQIVIVGANEGDEIPRLRHSYPRSRFLCFEPSPQWYRQLTARFQGIDYVECREVALSDQSGTATFHELPMPGNGSLLSPDADRWALFNQWDAKQVTSFQVQVSTLDEEAAGLDKIDLLWVDVQGAEGNVLRGGLKTFERVSAVLLEVALIESPYESAMTFPQLDAILQASGFSCVGIGTDGWNYAGNALWIRDISRRVFQPSER